MLQEYGTMGLLDTKGEDVNVNMDCMTTLKTGVLLVNLNML
jgi:hypothetical protein